jgi:hypothetical protein
LFFFNFFAFVFLLDLDSGFLKVCGLNEQVLKLLEEKNVLRMNLEFSLKENDFIKEKLKQAEENIEFLSLFVKSYFYILNNPINFQTLRSP